MSGSGCVRGRKKEGAEQRTSHSSIEWSSRKGGKDVIKITAKLNLFARVLLLETTLDEDCEFTTSTLKVGRVTNRLFPFFGHADEIFNPDENSAYKEGSINFGRSGWIIYVCNLHSETMWTDGDFESWHDEVVG